MPNNEFLRAAQELDSVVLYAKTGEVKPPLVSIAEHDALHEIQNQEGTRFVQNCIDAISTSGVAEVLLKATRTESGMKSEELGNYRSIQYGSDLTTLGKKAVLTQVENESPQLRFVMWRPTGGEQYSAKYVLESRIKSLYPEEEEQWIYSTERQKRGGDGYEASRPLQAADVGIDLNLLTAFAKQLAELSWRANIRIASLTETEEQHERIKEIIVSLQQASALLEATLYSNTPEQ